MPQRRRRNRLRRCLSIAGAASVGALLVFAGARSTGLIHSPVDLGIPGNWALQQERFFPPPPELLPSPPPHRSPKPYLPFLLRLLPVRGPQLEEDRDQSPPQLLEDDAVLLPDREVLVLAAEARGAGNTLCVFQGGASSPARALGRLPGPGRHAYLCLLPDSEKPLQQPALVLSSSSSSSSSSSAAAAAPAPAPAPAPANAGSRKLLNWNDSLVFDSAVLHGGHVLLFAKGPIHRKGVILTRAPNIQCIYRSAADGTEASFPAITAAQQVIRCPPPPSTPLNSRKTEFAVTVSLNGQEPIPSLATYSPQQSGLSMTPDRKLICACTMVRNVAKFLPEWVLYHASVGVEHFVLYDNGSEDDLAQQVARLKSAGIHISTVAWPWTKTQEAGLSHCAAAQQASCQWMAFIDVDEFLFSPKWDTFEKPSKSILESLLLSVDPHVGQIYLPCYDFGPSGQTAHPREGVCQGYTCRLTNPQRHKSLVRLDAVDDSLANSVHHFTLKPGFRFVWNLFHRVNHYKYQAWTEFKSKFKRRVSTFVADWSDPVNLQSHDRAPGLGVDPVEPAGWADSFCEVKDDAMQKLSVKWFGFGFRGCESQTELRSKGSPWNPHW